MSTRFRDMQLAVRDLYNRGVYPDGKMLTVIRRSNTVNDLGEEVSGWQIITSNLSGSLLPSSGTLREIPQGARNIQEWNLTIEPTYDVNNNPILQPNDLVCDGITTVTNGNYSCTGQVLLTQYVKYFPDSWQASLKAGQAPRSNS